MIVNAPDDRTGTFKAQSYRQGCKGVSSVFARHKAVDHGVLTTCLAADCQLTFTSIMSTDRQSEKGYVSENRRSEGRCCRIGKCVRRWVVAVVFGDLSI